MILGPQRFEYFLMKLEELLAQAAATKNPALFLYQNDARTKLFMLEGLSKLYAGMHNKKKFTSEIVFITFFYFDIRSRADTEL